MKHSEKMRVISEERYIALLNNSKNTQTQQKDEVIQEGGQEQEEPAHGVDNQHSTLPERFQDEKQEKQETLQSSLGSENKETLINKENLNDQPEITERMSIERVLVNIPKSHRTKAKRLLEYILSYPGSQLDWDKNGSVIYRGEPIPNTNISYLIRDIVSPLKKFTPIGSQTFREILVEIGAPIPQSTKKDSAIQGKDERLPPPPGIRDRFIKKKNKVNKVKSWQKIF